MAVGYSECSRGGTFHLASAVIYAPCVFAIAPADILERHRRSATDFSTIIEYHPVIFAIAVPEAFERHCRGAFHFFPALVYIPTVFSISASHVCVGGVNVIRLFSMGEGIPVILAHAAT